MTIERKQIVFLCVFFGLFIVIGLSLLGYGVVRYALYESAERVDATVVSATYRGNVADVTFSFPHNGEEKTAAAHFDNIKLEDGRQPYYEGKVVKIRVGRSGNVMTFALTEKLALITGAAFTAAGTGFLYFTVLRKRNFLDMAREYENAMVPPEELTDATAQYEATADQLTKLPARSVSRMTGEGAVWGKRIADRFRSFTVAENIIACLLLVVPIVLLSIEPLFYGGKVTLSSVLVNTLLWLFVFAFVGMILKAIVSAYYAAAVKCGKFCEKRIATVKQCAFESSLYMQSGEFSRTHTVFKKFRVVAEIDGKRGVGYIKGNVPPPQGARLRVLIRPNKPKRWIIDTQ
mgnify:CR=1 FL=1